MVKNRQKPPVFYTFFKNLQKSCQKPSRDFKNIHEISLEIGLQVFENMSGHVAFLNYRSPQPRH